MSKNLPLLGAKPGTALTLLQVLTCLLLVAATIHVVHQYARTRLALSGDEYYFYYAAAHNFVATPSDPIWGIQSEIAAARDDLLNLAKGSAQCEKATLAAREDLFQLAFLLKFESSGQGYGPATAFQDIALRVWEGAAHRLVDSKESGYASDLGRRIAFSIAFPMAIMIALSFLLPTLVRSVSVLCAVGLYALLHAFVPPAAEAYWTLAQQQLESPLWIMSTPVGLPFLNPRYSDSLFSIAPRGYLVLPLLMALACRWRGVTGWSYVVLASLSLLHPTIGPMIFGMFLAADLALRPRLLKERLVATSAVAVALFVALSGAGETFMQLAGGKWTVMAAPAVVATGLLAAYAVFMPRLRWFNKAAAWSDKNQILTDVMIFGPLFLGIWFILALLHTELNVMTGYGLVNLATKSAAVAHQVFFFGLFCLAFRSFVAFLTSRFGPTPAAYAVLLVTAAVALAAAGTAARVTDDRPSLGTRYARLSQQHDEVIHQRPLDLGSFETHLMWHRIVRQREMGGDWVKRAIDLEPYRAMCSKAR